MTRPIARHLADHRMSRIVVHGDTVYLAGVIAADRSGDIKAQTAEVLSLIDQRLASVGSGRHKLLSAQIWLKDIERDFQGMNDVWDAWVPADAAPARATCQALLASPELRVEIIVTAAL